MQSESIAQRPPTRFSQFLALTKPRIANLAVFSAVIGMFLSTPGSVPWRVLVGGTLGIWLLAGAAFAFNCLLELKIDARMNRTRHRASAQGAIAPAEIAVFSLTLGAAGAFLLATCTNVFTMWLTIATFIGYALIYTAILKPATPQNIVIGGLSGAMPPALGWAAVTNTLPADAWLLVLIVFVWTPPHFWALALYRREDYRKSGLPMLPVTHGIRFTQLQILLYSILLCAVAVMPWLTGMSGSLYLICAIILSAAFLMYAVRLYRHYSDALAKSMFRYSIIYLTLLFAVLLIDHRLIT
ncbi:MULTISPECIES: heme o synthase [Paraburkholderia]|uniref:Protoheme IX farnesyltransferase n=4 Tax=Burkholderiaceae TaxID=119060 RepID=A0AAQ1GF93_9BURK|nr:heme o synthase [Paraburkholderia tropica]MBB2979677.1 protoheme IX farnesyltransferase [Paraburkholderia tropica]MBB3000723.1 protoheme IX farnesyltransferase [Paraburkholderia tropica]MBB6320353.1 protoheme IX farnesyltransferase [Paraburkholderia tropica]MDE1143842.1 heme o synthase [Paraburkholderia tropica]PXX17057.1 protoheme IX farnesyltransferase [Paraburkholderia tropica]